MAETTKVSGEMYEAGKKYRSTLDLPGQTRTHIQDIVKVRGYGSISSIVAEAVKKLHDEI